MYIDDRGRKVFRGQEAIDHFYKGVRKLCENRKLHYKTTFQDLPVSVENRKGSVRSGTDDDGEEWRTKMKVPYGYIPGTKGVDGDALDVFVGPDENAAYAYVVHCNTPDGKRFDEDKVMLGFSSSESAKRCFNQHYDDSKFFGGIDAIPMWKFRKYAFVRKHTERKLVASKNGAHSSPSLRRYDDGMVPVAVAPIQLVHSFYSDVYGSKMKHKDIEKNIDLYAPDEMDKKLKKEKKPTKSGHLAEVKHKRASRIHESFEARIDTLGRGTDRDMKRAILGHHKDEMIEPKVREGGQGSGRHKMGLDERLTSLIKTYDVVKDPAAKKVLARKIDNIRHEIEHINESEEHGVQGQKWGIKHARNDGAGQKGFQAKYRALANDPHTMNMMQVVHRSQGVLNAIAHRNKPENQLQQKPAQPGQKQQQPKPKPIEQNHEEALDALKELGWKILEVGGRLTGTEGLVGAVKSVVKSPAGQKLFLNTNRNGDHKLTTDKEGKIPASKPHQPIPKKRVA